MQAGYWFVQPHRRGGQIEAEQPCANCEEVVARVKAFRNANADPNMKLRVHVPAHATNNEAFCWPIDLIAACAWNRIVGLIDYELTYGLGSAR